MNLVVKALVALTITVLAPGAQASGATPGLIGAAASVSAPTQGPTSMSITSWQTACYEGWAVIEGDYLGEAGVLRARVTGRKARVQVVQRRNGGYYTVELGKRVGWLRLKSEGRVVLRMFIGTNPCYPQQELTVRQKGRALRLNVNPDLPGRQSWTVRMVTDQQGLKLYRSFFTNGRAERAVVVLDKGEKPIEITISGWGDRYPQRVFQPVGKGAVWLSRELYGIGAKVGAKAPTN